MQSRREFLGLAASATGTALLQSAPTRKPNFLIILADDMGFSDAHCYGGDIDTPNFDRMAAAGLRFTQTYSTARCGPSRTCLLTGQYAQQTASDIMTPGKIPDYTRFLPEYLKPLGYRSYHTGQLHLKAVPRERRSRLHQSLPNVGGVWFLPQNQAPLDGVAPAKPEPGYYSTTAIADYGVRF